MWPYRIFPHYLINGTIFGKTLLNIKCVFWFSLKILPENFLIIRIIERDIIINVHRYMCKVLIVIVRFNWNVNFLDIFSENPRIYKFRKILPMEVEFLQNTEQRLRINRIYIIVQSETTLWHILYILYRIYSYIVRLKVKQSCYRPGVARRVPWSKVPRSYDNGTGWW